MQAQAVVQIADISDQKSIPRKVPSYLPYMHALHAHVSPGSGVATPSQIGDQNDYDQQNQRTPDRDRDDVRGVDGVAILGNRELAVLLFVECFELQLGNGHSGSGVITCGQVQLLGTIAVVGHVRRGLEQGLIVGQGERLIFLSVRELICGQDQDKVQSR